VKAKEADKNFLSVKEFSNLRKKRGRERERNVYGAIS